MSNRKIKIAIALSRYLPADLSGAEAIAQVNAENLVKAGHEVTVLTSYIAKTPSSPQLPHEEWINGVHVLRFFVFRFEQLNFLKFLRKTYTPPPPPPDHETANVPPPSPLVNAFFFLIFHGASWLFAPRLFLHVLRGTYDIVHITPFPHTHIWVAAKAAALARVPLVFTPAYHVAVQKSMAWQIRYLETCVTKFAVFTEREKIDLTEIGIPSQKMVVIPPGLVPPDETSISGVRLRNDQSLANAPIILFAGTKSFDKGFVHLVDAMAIVQKTHPNAVLLAMGPEVGQRFGEHMTEKIANAINFGYLRNEKWDLYDACDVFAMPSRVDSFGLVYAEAWMRGKPVIGARCGSVPWVIHENIDGLLVPFGDVEELARSIIRLIDQPSLRKALGDAGREHVFHTYTVDCVAQRLSELYASLVRQ